MGADLDLWAGLQGAEVLLVQLQVRRSVHVHRRAEEAAAWTRLDTGRYHSSLAALRWAAAARGDEATICVCRG